MKPFEQIENALKCAVVHDPEYKTFREKTTKLSVLGLRLPVIHKIEMSGFPFYKDTSKQVLQTWSHIWQTSKIHEAMLVPLLYYRRNIHLLDDEHWRTMKRWIERVENWEHADALCALYSIHLEKVPKLVMPTLKKWNRSQNPWKRRASIVSTIYYASPRRKTPTLKTVLSLIKPLLRDKDAYVQKAVGWQLRECYKLWPRQTFEFFKKHVLSFSAIAFSYATEKLTAQEKKTLKKLRERRNRFVKL
jgi:3-methyladenine DNA glycosylase AlkD